MEEFTESDWLENFRMGRHTFIYVCSQLRPYIKRKITIMREPKSEEKRVAVTIWCLDIYKCRISYHRPPF